MKGDVELGGGPAFPLSIGTQVDQHLCGPGMTLRDYFAGQALAGILSGGFGDTIPHDDVLAQTVAASFAYSYAAAMLKERDQ